jgi:predicted methyltransferase
MARPLPNLERLLAATLACLAAMAAPARTLAAAQTPGIPEDPGATAVPAQKPAESIYRDPVASPLLDRHYEGAQTRAPVPELERPGAEVFDQRFQIVYAAQPRPGMRVADIGAGSGVFTGLFARAVGAEGVVYGVDTSPDIAARLKALAQTYRVSNIVAVVNTPEDIRLPAEAIDLAFLCDSYHRIENHAAFLDSIRKALVPYGTLIIIDDRRPPDPRSPWDKQHAGADRDLVTAQVEKAGFRLVDELKLLRDRYFLRFERLADAPGVEVGPIESAAPNPGP